MISFNQDDWLKPYIELNNKVRTEAKNEFEKDFFKLMNNAIFSKTMENVKRKKKKVDIKIVTTEKRKNYLVSEPNYHTAKFFIKNLLAVEMKKTQIIMNKPVYLGLSILQLVTKYFRLTLVFM